MALRLPGARWGLSWQGLGGHPPPPGCFCCSCPGQWGDGCLRVGGMMPRALTALSLGHSCGENTQPRGICDLPTLAGVLLAPWQLASSLWPSQLIPAALCPHATSWGQAGHNSFRDRQKTTQCLPALASVFRGFSSRGKDKQEYGVCTFPG